MFGSWIQHGFDFFCIQVHEGFGVSTRLFPTSQGSHKYRRWKEPKRSELHLYFLVVAFATTAESKLKVLEDIAESHPGFQDNALTTRVCLGQLQALGQKNARSASRQLCPVSR